MKTGSIADLSILAADPGSCKVKCSRVSPRPEPVEAGLAIAADGQPESSLLRVSENPGYTQYLKLAPAIIESAEACEVMLVPGIAPSGLRNGPLIEFSKKWQ